MPRLGGCGLSATPQKEKLREVTIMPEMNMIQETMQKAFDLADQTSESFVLAVTAAYLAGIEQGKKEAVA